MKTIITLIRQDLFDSKFSLLAVIVISGFLGVLWGGFYPSIRDSADALNEYVQNAQGFADVFFNLEGGALDFSDYSVYIATEYFSFFWAVVFVPFLIAWAVRLAANAEKGTLALVLAHPVSRGTYAISQSLALILKTMVCAVIAMASVWLPAYTQQGVELNEVAWFRFTIFLWLTMLAFTMLAFLASIATMSKNKGIWLATGIIVGGYVLNAMAKLVESAEFLRYFSVWNYFGDPSGIMSGKEMLPAEGVLVFAAISALGIILGPVIFRTKDLPNG